MKNDSIFYIFPGLNRVPKKATTHYIYPIYGDPTDTVFTPQSGHVDAPRHRAKIMPDRAAAPNAAPTPAPRATTPASPAPKKPRRTPAAHRGDKAALARYFDNEAEIDQELRAHSYEVLSLEYQTTETVRRLAAAQDLARYVAARYAAAVAEKLEAQNAMINAKTGEFWWEQHKKNHAAMAKFLAKKHAEHTK